MNSSRALDPASITQTSRRSPRRTGLLAAASVAVLATVGGVLAVTLPGGGSGKARPSDGVASISVAPSTPPTTAPAPTTPAPSAPPSSTAPTNGQTTKANLTAGVRNAYAAVLTKADGRAQFDKAGARALLRQMFASEELLDKAWGSDSKLGDLGCGQQGINGALIESTVLDPTTASVTVTLFKGTERLPKAAVLSVEGLISKITKVDCGPASSAPPDVERSDALRRDGAFEGEDAVEARDDQDTVDGRRHAAQHEAAFSAAGPAVYGDQEAQARRVERVDTGDVEDEVAVSPVDGGVHALPDVRRGVDVQRAAQMQFAGVAPDMHVASSDRGLLVGSLVFF